MKQCRYCKKQIDDNAIFCSHCGARCGEGNPYGDGNPYGTGYNPYGQGYGGGQFYGYSRPEPDNTGSMAIAVLSFLFWQVGLILWLFMRHRRPGKANSAAKGAMSSVSVSMPIVGLVLWLIWRDEGSGDFAKVCGISAIVGAGVYALVLAAVVLLAVLGVIL